MYRNILINGMFGGPPMVNKPISQLKSIASSFDQTKGMVPKITQLRESLGYKPKDEQWLTLNTMSNDLQMVDEITRKPLQRPLLSIAKDRVSSTMTFAKLVAEC